MLVAPTTSVRIGAGGQLVEIDGQAGRYRVRVGTVYLPDDDALPPMIGREDATASFSYAADALDFGLRHVAPIAVVRLEPRRRADLLLRLAQLALDEN